MRIMHINEQKDFVMSFDQFFENQLNQKQKEIVSHKNGVLLICAGAGSGKTRIITARMTHLILKHTIPAHSIIALTFTNKAAREMRERMLSFLTNENNLPYVGTFHSYCVRLLKSNNHLVRIKDFSIIDDDDQEKLLKMILNRHNVVKKITPKQVSSLISHLKNEAITGEIPWHLVPDTFMRSIIMMYEREKTESKSLDFDDLLLETLRLVKNNPEFKQMYQSHVRHFLVDEYQDTNKVQHALLQELSCDNAGNFSLDSLCVVGDEDQSIYSWRGATVKNIVHFKQDFPSVQSYTIDQNYRSVQPILDIANKVIAHNKERNPKQLWSDRQARDRVRLITCMSGYHEADLIAAAAQTYSQKYPSHSCALLYRSHYQSRVLEEALLRQGIPYKIVGGIQFYERQEIKDLLCYLRLINNPFDRIAFSRIYNVPSRGLGDKFFEQFMLQWQAQPLLDITQIAREMIAAGLVTGTKASALEKLIDIVSCSPSEKATTILDMVIKKTQYLSYLEEAFDEEEGRAKIENVKELLNALRAFEDRNPENSVSTFLQEVALLQEIASQPQDETIQLMTLHAAKGLEFDFVIITGIEEQLLPSVHALASGNLEEERRLLYVGITRARERLLLSHARYRHTYGQVAEHRLSRFIEEINCQQLVHQDATQWGINFMKNYIVQWLVSIAVPPTPVVSPKPLQWADDPFQPATSVQSAWKVNQAVMHQTFGVGKIEKIEEKGHDKTYLTIKFSYVRKRIDARFVKQKN